MDYRMNPHKQQTKPNTVNSNKMAHDECIRLIQYAINTLQSSMDWENIAQVKAQSLGLQAEKRQERYCQRKELMTLQYLQSVANDLSGAELFPERMAINFPQNLDIPGYFKNLLSKTWETYEIIHSIANEMVVKKYKCIAEPLYCYVGCLFNEIIDTRRAIKEGDLDGWSYHHVSRYQVSAENKHDKLERLEEKQGYHY